MLSSSWRSHAPASCTSSRPWRQRRSGTRGRPPARAAGGPDRSGPPAWVPPVDAPYRGRGNRPGRGRMPGTEFTFVVPAACSASHSSPGVARCLPLGVPSTVETQLHVRARLRLELLKAGLGDLEDRVEVVRVGLGLRQRRAHMVTNVPMRSSSHRAPGASITRSGYASPNSYHRRRTFDT